MKKTNLLIISTLLLFILPFISSYIRWDGPPPGFGDFPAQQVHPEPPFSIVYFSIASVIAFCILIFFLFPRLFGFKKAGISNNKREEKTGFPKWFLPGAISLALSWFFMWGRFEIVEPIDHYTFVPLWWGAILVLDGIVYKRSGGKSLIATKPDTMKLLAVVSCVSWFVFEFLNFFVVENWYYPNNEIFTNFGNISWQLLSYTTVLPAIFEWYSLLKTTSIKNRYTFGPKINISRPLQIAALVMGLALSFFMGLYPFILFWVLWVGLVPVLVPAMSLSKFWTPFTPIAERGNWSPVLLIAIATLLNGFFWEFWNFGSEWFHDYAPTNPNYWKYSVPYLDKFHIFSEMPVLGYFGYLFFGVGCWVLWLVVAYIFGFNPDIELFDDNDSTDLQ